MRTLDANIEAHLNDARYTVFLLLELISPTNVTTRFTDAPIAIVWGGFTWANVWFSSSEIVVDGEGETSATINMEDTSRTLRSLAFSNDLNKYSVRLSEVWADASNTLFGQDVRIYGKCDGVRCEGEDTDDPRAVLAVRGLFADSAVGIGPLQDYTKTCRYKQFKGAQCKYAGAQTFCDRLYATCVNVMANQINFGGFRFALGPDQKIQWGTNSGSTKGRPVEAYAPPPPPVTPHSPIPALVPRSPEKPNSGFLGTVH